MKDFNLLQYPLNLLYSLKKEKIPFPIIYQQDDMDVDTDMQGDKQEEI